MEYFANHAASPTQVEWGQEMLKFHAEEFHKQLAAGVPMAVGSDVGPFPDGTQAREFVLMAKYGMPPLAVLQADLINGARLLGWQDQIDALKPWLLGRCGCGSGKSAQRYQRARAHQLCHEGRRDLSKVSRRIQHRALKSLERTRKRGFTDSEPRPTCTKRRNVNGCSLCVVGRTETIVRKPQGLGGLIGIAEL